MELTAAHKERKESIVQRRKLTQQNNPKFIRVEEGGTLCAETLVKLVTSFINVGTSFAMGTKGDHHNKVIHKPQWARSKARGHELVALNNVISTLGCVESVKLRRKVGHLALKSWQWLK